jgi:hypothetical protein
MRPLRWALCLVLLVLTASISASAQQRMADQLFGILYDPEKVHFDRMPSTLPEKCPSLRGRYVAAWVYGHFKTVDSEYFLISGLMEFREDTPGGARTIAPEEGDGLAVALQGSRCLVDQAGYFFDQGVNSAKNATPIMVPTSVLTGILQDAFKRYVVAFGGRREFLEHVNPRAALPLVREQLEIFEKEPH